MRPFSRTSNTPGWFDDVANGNYDIALGASFVEAVGKALGPVAGGFGVIDGSIVDASTGWAPDLEGEPAYADGGVRLVDIADLQVSGPHNLSNAVAVTAYEAWRQLGFV